MLGGIDAEKVDRSVVESRPGIDGAAEDGRTGSDIGELPADAHDFRRVRNSVERMAARLVRVPHIFWRNQQALGRVLKTRAEKERAVTAEGGIDKILREPLSLGL